MTIRELARKAGCSHATVSLALRNHPRISVETRKRIALLAGESGYCRDPLVSSLMGQLRTSRKSRSIEKLAYVSWWDTPQELKKDPNATVGFRGACRRARELGYEIEEFWAKQPGLNSKRLSKILYTRGIRGIIVGSLPRPMGHVSLDWAQFASVAVGPTVVKPNLHRVLSSCSQGMQLSLRVLRHRGYKRIAFTSLVDHGQRTNQGWLASYLFDSHSLPRKAVIPALLLREWDSDKFLAWIHRYQPDAILSNASEPLKFLRHHKFRVPEEIGFASLDRFEETEPIAGVDQLRGQMGGATVDLLVSLVESNQFGLPKHPKIIHFENVWKDGPTVRQPKGKRMPAPDVDDAFSL